MPVVILVSICWNIGQNSITNWTWPLSFDIGTFNLLELIRMSHWRDSPTVIFIRILHVTLCLNKPKPHFKHFLHKNIASSQNSLTRFPVKLPWIIELLLWLRLWLWLWLSLTIAVVLEYYSIYFKGEIERVNIECLSHEWFIYKEETSLWERCECNSIRKMMLTSTTERKRV